MTASLRPIAVVLSVTFGCMAGTEGTSEYAIKGAYVYNFAKFVEWPQGELGTVFTICVYGKTPLAGFLEEMAQRKFLSGRALIIRRMSEEGQEFDTCKLVFFGAVSRVSMQAVLDRLKGRRVLTVGESEVFTEFGGMITLIVEADRVRFDVNPRAAADAHLKISSKLLGLARKVRSGD